MHAFTRLTSFLLFVLSLSFLTCAAPTPVAPGSNALAVRSGTGQNVLDICIDLKARVDVTVKALVECVAIADVAVEVDALVAEIGVAAQAILDVGAHIKVDDGIKVKIAVEVAAIICVIVQACLSVCVKFGIGLVLVILAKIDACIHLLLINLDICIEGCVATIAKLVVGASANALVTLNFKLCISILAIVGL